MTQTKLVVMLSTAAFTLAALAAIKAFAPPSFATRF